MEAFQKDIGAIAAAARAYNTNGRHRNPGEHPSQAQAGFQRVRVQRLRRNDEAAASRSGDTPSLTGVVAMSKSRQLPAWSPLLRRAAVMEAATLLEDAAEDELAMRQHDLDAAEELALELA